MHTLEVDKIDCYPINLYFWKGWVGNEKDINNSKLDAIEIDKINIPQFTIKNRNLLSKLIEAIFLKDKKIVIKLSTQKEGIELLYFIERAFPLFIAKNITFSTYQFSDTDCLDINLVIGESDWDGINTNGFYFFDLTQNLYPDININNVYSSLIIKILENSEKLKEFYDFFKYFDSIKLDKNLNFILKLFLFRDGHETIDDLEEVLYFISTYTKKEYIDEFLEYLAPIIKNIKTTDELEIILFFYINIYSSKVVENINEILTILLNASLQSHYSLSKFDEYIKQLDEKDVDFEEKFIIYFLERVEKEKINIEDEDEFYLLIKKFKKYTKQSDILIYEDFQNIIIEHIKTTKTIKFEIISLFKKEEQIKLIIEISHRLSTDELKRLAKFFVETYKDENYYILIKELMDREIKKKFIVLSFEYKQETISNVEKGKFLNNYISKVGNYPEIYYNFLEEKEKVSQIKKWDVNIKNFEKYSFFNDKCLMRIKEQK